MLLDNEQTKKIIYSNETGSVFIHILSGNNYTTLIAELRNKQPATINEQLRNLESIGLIVRGERDQKQRYNVIWSKVLELIKEINELEYKEILSDLNKALEKEPKYNEGIERSNIKGIWKESNSKFENLLNDKYSLIFFEHFLKTIAKNKTAKGRSPDESIQFLLSEMIIKITEYGAQYSKDKTKALKNKQLAEFLNKLLAFANGLDFMYENAFDTAFKSTIDNLENEHLNH